MVKINKDLTGSALDEPESPAFLLGRWRATLAHEASHILLHRCLFDLNPKQRGLFDTDEENEPQTVDRSHFCLKRDVSFVSNMKNWREFQANLGMAALLMPKSIFLDAFRVELAQSGWSELRIEQNSQRARQLVARLASIFQVSRQAALIRCDSLRLLAVPGQGELA